MEIEIKLDKSKLRKKGYPVIISIYVTPTDRLYPTTGYFSQPDQWDEIKNEPKPSHPQYYGLYEFVYKKKIVINQILERKEQRTSEQLKKLILTDNRESLTEFWKDRIKELEDLGKEGNARYFKSNLNSLNEFNENVLFSQINFSFIERYRDFHLKKTDKFGRKTVSPNGVIVYIRALRTVYNLAVKRKHYIPVDSTNHFEDVFPDPEPTSDKEFTLIEMRKIVNTDLKNKYYDIFLLCFLFGGIDYVDLLNLKYDHIRNNRIKFERFKGGTSEIIDNYIYPEVWEILDKYKDETGFLMPLHIYESKSEKYSYRDNYIRRFRTWLKNKAGVTSYFTSKTPRSTFIDIGKKLLLSRDVIKEITGHSYKDIHSLYEGRFSNEMRDEVHRKIIDAVLKKDGD
ncbi:site-specific integrase [Chryseobacterium indologenes]|uniref:site-specific integrase n=1 Tax=Chryseobacterium indologenes TaxID=253 RepID=UPI001625C2B8|nr:site-specific integrase [Chryseobacterium indologenes]